MDLTATVRDEDLVAVDEIATVLFRGACDDSAEIRSRLRFGQIHGSHDFAGGKARQIFSLQFFGSVLLDVFGNAGLKSENGHQSGIRARNHLEQDVGDERRKTEAIVFLLHAKADEAGLAKFVERFLDVGRVDDLAILELCALVPASAKSGLHLLTDLCAGLQDFAKGCAIDVDISLFAFTPGKIRLPVDQLVEIEKNGVAEICTHEDSL